MDWHLGIALQNQLTPLATGTGFGPPTALPSVEQSVNRTLAPAAIALLKPSELPAELRNLALEMVAAARLAGFLHPMTGRAIAGFLRPANPCYALPLSGHTSC
jgi:hypothetical protein